MDELPGDGKTGARLFPSAQLADDLSWLLFSHIYEIIHDPQNRDSG